MKKKLISFGEILFDIIDGKAILGGAPLNFASHASSLGCECYMLSAVGDDILGEAALAHMLNRDIDCGLISRSKKETGKCTVSLDADGTPSYNLLSDVAYDDIKASIEELRAIRADVFYFGTLAARGEQNRLLLREILANVHFEEIFCDINIRMGCFSHETVLLCLAHATVLKFSDDLLEESALRDALEICDGSIAETINKRFPNIKIILHTLGEKGSEIFDCRSGERFVIPAVENPNPVSTVGAGDSYGAAFLCHYLTGTSLPEAGEEAAKLAARVVGLPGAI